jgi:DNA transposition AAA+ family ATPase
MKHKFVRTENHRRLAAAVAFMEERGSLTSPLCLVHGAPGVGKSRNINNYGAEHNAVLVQGHVGMNLDGLVWTISKQLGVKHNSNRTIEMGEQISALQNLRPSLIFDEAQFGLSMRWKKVESAGIEYVRQLGEAAGVFVLLVCHDSEVMSFSHSAHIRTRIAHRVELKNAGESDTVKFVLELSDVCIGDGVGELIHKQTGGKYRLIENAISALERIAKVKQVDRIELADISNLVLVVDHEEGLIPKIERSTKKTAGGR